VFLSINTTAQIKNAILNKVNESINKKESSGANHKQNTDKQNPDSSKITYSTSGTVSSGNKNDIEPIYKFTDNVLVEIQSYKKSGEKNGDPVNTRYLFSKDKNYFGSEILFDDKKGNTAHSKNIYEFDKNKVITLTDNNGNKIAMVIKFNLSAEAENYVDSNKVTIVKTGRTKTILTYLCEEYILTDDEGNKTEMWVSPKVPFNMGKIAAINKAGKNNALSNYPISGFTLEMTIYNKKGVKTTTWIVKEINLNQQTSISTDGYKFFGF
jgi:hypothetical protein